MQNKKLIILSAILIVIFSFLSLIGYFTRDTSKENQISAILKLNTLGNIKQSDYTGLEITALDLLKKYHIVNTTSSEYGEFVDCIDNICSNSNHYWMYYVNGNLSSVGAGLYQVKDKDIVEFVYEKPSF